MNWPVVIFAAAAFVVTGIAALIVKGVYVAIGRAVRLPKEPA